jgi:hypothetical protein
MNERQPYEHRIAEKLQQLPSPDVETSWQKMKRLLDDNQQPKSGGGSNGPGAWWRTALIAIVIITGLWLYTENKKSSGKEMAVTNKANTGAAIPANGAADKNDMSGKKNNTDKQLKATNDNTATLNTIPVNTNKKNTADKDNNAAAGNQIAPDTKQNALAGKGISFEPAINKNSAADKSKALNPGDNTNTKTTLTPADKKATHAKNVDASSLALHHNNTLIPGIKLNEKNNVLSLKNNSRIKDIKPNDITGNNASNHKPIANRIKDKLTKDSDSNTGNDGTAGAGSGYNNSTAIKHNNKKEKNNTVLTTNSDINDEALLAKQNAWYETLHGFSVSNEQKPINTFLSVGDSIEAEVDGNALLSKETKDLANKARRAYAEEAMAKKEKKSFRLNLSNVFKPFSLHIDAEPWWAAGFALNNSVAVNAQNRYNYNINAKSGVLGDYIPSPYVQFHLNDYVYMQTELNLSTPQLTPQLLLYQKSAEVIGAAGFTQQKSIYVQKLYYFNWPVSLHYSPINNLYFAAGLQFSSFQSGLALIQNKRYSTQGGNPGDPVSIENSIEKFKDDSLAAKLSPTEWRWQTGADYYWNRFTIGLRYNKAFKDLLNVNVSSSLPLTTNRNSAFLFFMRYNLFEGRNKNNAGSKQSLVRY